MALSDRKPSFVNPYPLTDTPDSDRFAAGGRVHARIHRSSSYFVLTVHTKLKGGM